MIAKEPLKPLVLEFDKKGSKNKELLEQDLELSSLLDKHVLLNFSNAAPYILISFMLIHNRVRIF